MAMAGAVVIASTAVITLSTFNYLRCDPLLRLGADIDRVRSFTSSDSLCIGIVPESQWNELVPHRAAFEKLRAGNESAKGNGEVTIAVLGALRTTEPGVREVIRRQLDGVVLAQHESKRLGQPVHVLLVDNGSTNIDYRSEAAALERTASLGGRPGINFPAVVFLGLTGDRLPDVDIGIPTFSAGVRYTVEELSPLSETREKFDHQLRESLMRRFVQYTLRTEETLASLLWLDSDVALYRLDTGYTQGCVSAERRPALVHEEPDKRRVELFLSQVKDCGKEHVRLVAADSSVA